MKTYTYSQARQKLATLLDEAGRGEFVRIRRRDGRYFLLRAVKPSRSPLDVPGVQIAARAGETLEWIREGRRREQVLFRALDRARTTATKQAPRAGRRRKR